MRAARKVAVVVLVAACAAGLGWMLGANATGQRLVNNANVLSAVAGVAALALAALALWPKRTRPQATTAATPLDAAVDCLATETLRYWRQQAKDRRITTPSPAEVRWTWGPPQVAAPVHHLNPTLLSAGVITRLREQLYQPQTTPNPRPIVILGGPGAGKTTAMLLLLVDILEHRTAAAEPVPVWLTLGGWNPHTTSLPDWAAITLRRDYPSLTADAHGGQATASELVRTGRVALFLDGLDEMADTLRAHALHRIDEEAQGLRIVLTSRPDEYTTAITEQRLWRAAVVEVLPVTARHARDFLLAEQLDQRRAAWQPVTDQLQRAPDSAVAQTLTSPLALSLARDAYAHANPAALLDTHTYPTPAALLRHLLTQTLVIAYPDPVRRDHATRWLTWIAQHMGAHRDLRWWDIPGWMTPSRKALNRTVGLVAGLVIGLASGIYGGLGEVGLVGVMGRVEGAPVDRIMIGVVFGLLAGLLVTPVFGLAGGLVGWLVGWLVGDHWRRFDEPHAFRLWWPSQRELRALAGGLVYGLLSGLAVGLLSGPMFGIVSGVVFGIVFGLLVGIVFGLLNVWRRPLETLTITNPAHIYRSDRSRTVVVGLVALLAGGPLAPIMAAFGLGPAVALSAMSLAWRMRGKRPRFMRLLQAATDRQILRQVGAIYQFRHAVLQDLLAGPSTPAETAPFEPDITASQGAQQH